MRIMQATDIMKSVVVDTSVRRAVVEHCRNWSPKETGGILLGFDCGQALHVVGFGGPGPLARHSRSAFVRDGEFAQALLDEAVSSSDGHVDYLGEWHSHPAPVGPSNRDLASVEWISRNGRYASPQPLLIVVTKTHVRWDLRAFFPDGQRLNPARVSTKCECLGTQGPVSFLVTP